MSKSNKMYSKSPKIEKDKDGKPGIKKPGPDEKEATEAGGSELEGAGDGMPVDVHEKERASMMKRHEEELVSMHSRHSKDMKEMHKRHQEVLPAEGENIEGTK